jgi:hypothetical protein
VQQRYSSTHSLTSVLDESRKLHIRAAILPGKNLCAHSRLGEPWSRSGHFWKEIKSLVPDRTNILFPCLMINFCSPKHNKLISASYESPFLRNHFKTPFTASRVCMCRTSRLFLQPTWASRTTDVPESHATRQPLYCHPCCKV